MNRRQFLGAAAAAVSLPLGDRDDSQPAIRDCDVCGAEMPAEMLDVTAVPETAPVEGEICWACQFVQQHTPAEDACAKCGEDVSDEPGGGFHLELEHALGVADLPAFKTATLCGDCSSWIACDINNEGVWSDPTAHKRHLRLADLQTRRLKEVQRADE